MREEDVEEDEDCGENDGDEAEGSGYMHLGVGAEQKEEGPSARLSAEAGKEEGKAQERSGLSGGAVERPRKIRLFGGIFFYQISLIRRVEPRLSHLPAVRGLISFNTHSHCAPSAYLSVYQRAEQGSAAERDAGRVTSNLTCRAPFGCGRPCVRSRILGNFCVLAHYDTQC